MILSSPFHKFGHVYLEARWTIGNFGHGMPCPYISRRPTDLSGHSMLCPPALFPSFARRVYSSRGSADGLCGSCIGPFSQAQSYDSAVKSSLKLVSCPRQDFLIAPGDVAHALSVPCRHSWRHVSLVRRPLLLGGGMPARMPAQHAESVRHVPGGDHILNTLVQVHPEHFACNPVTGGFERTTRRSCGCQVQMATLFTDVRCKVFSMCPDRTGEGRQALRQRFYSGHPRWGLSPSTSSRTESALFFSSALSSSLRFSS